MSQENPTGKLRSEGRGACHKHTFAEIADVVAGWFAEASHAQCDAVLAKAEAA